MPAAWGWPHGSRARARRASTVRWGAGTAGPRCAVPRVACGSGPGTWVRPSGPRCPRCAPASRSRTSPCPSAVAWPSRPARSRCRTCRPRPAEGGRAAGERAAAQLGRPAAPVSCPALERSARRGPGHIPSGHGGPVAPPRGAEPQVHGGQRPGGLAVDRLASHRGTGRAAAQPQPQWPGPVPPGAGPLAGLLPAAADPAVGAVPGGGPQPRGPACPGVAHRATCQRAPRARGQFPAGEQAGRSAVCPPPRVRTGQGHRVQHERADQQVVEQRRREHLTRCLPGDVGIAEDQPGQRVQRLTGRDAKRHTGQRQPGGPLQGQAQPPASVADQAEHQRALPEEAAGRRGDVEGEPGGEPDDRPVARASSQRHRHHGHEDQVRPGTTGERQVVQHRHLDQHRGQNSRGGEQDPAHASPPPRRLPRWHPCPGCRSA